MPNLGLILSHAWNMKKNGRAEGTINTHVQRLKNLDKQCNITEPEEVKDLLARLKWQTNTKLNVAIIYDGFLKSIGKTWSRPEYKHESTLPAFIPMEAEIDILVASATPKTAALLQTLKETAARIGEVTRIQWKDVDFERKAIYIRAEKGSNSRILPISDKLLAMLGRLPKTSDKVFKGRTHGYRTTLQKLRNRTATKLNNPRLKQIHFHTFRHWKATMEYHRIKDIMTVKAMLGHKSVLSTQVYVNIEATLFLCTSDEWICKATRDPVEAQKLVEAGFQYVLTTPDGLMMFRKRK
ncbi:site-specific integrase [Candidatus Bathyarchaeota archaeon]|nr:site-specific integrase [Candidatus Bathyarchaeota archaeon]